MNNAQRSTTSRPTRESADKARTSEALRLAQTDISSFLKNGGRECIANNATIDLREIYKRSAQATTSQQHYNLYMEAALLKGRVHALWQMSMSYRDIMSNRITPERRDAIVEAHSAAMEKWTMHFAQTFDVATSRWQEFNEQLNTVHDLFVEIGRACFEAELAGKEELQNSLLTVDKAKKVTKAQHDVFASMVNAHDYHYSYSDCSRTYRAGKAQEDRIVAIAEAHRHFASMWDAVNKASGARTGYGAQLDAIRAKAID
jgi:hypothetical protein